MPSDRHADEGAQPAMRTRLAAALGGSQVTHSELEAYVDRRYEELQEQIMAGDLDDYGDQLDVVACKGRQEELIDLLLHFEVDE